MTTARSRTALRVAIASDVDLATAIDAFLSQPDLAPTTRAKYRQTLTVLEDELGDAPVTGAGLAGVVAQRWHHASPATWNRHVATVRSFARYCERTRILKIDGDVELQRRAEKHDHTRSIALASLERFWERRDIDLRERTLWRLLYETAARADEILRLNVEDLDIPAKRARTRSKDGDIDWLFFGSGSARLLPRLIAGRRAGPVFLSNLRPSAARAPAAADICPLTGRARLSYRRAAELLVAQTGWTLHQFRHSALTHLAEADVQLPLLMAKSRHRSLRTLQRYARPGPDAVAALTAAHDPGRRR
ncbi:MAG: site-specific integrase [Actinobacteria bacterium]|nr:site-specific integrase [Actinomycetota bacterium]